LNILGVRNKTVDVIRRENAEFQIIEALKLNRAKRAELGEFFIEGIESIKMASRAAWEFTRIMVSGAAELSPWGRDFIRTHPGVRVLEMSGELYRKLCDRSEPSEMLVTARRRSLSLGDLVLPEAPFILLCDRPSDTGNLGAVIRSLNALGGDALLILGHGVDLYDPKVIRASLGSIFFTPAAALRSNGELGDFIRARKAGPGLQVWGTDSKGAMPLAEAPLKRPLLLIIGNEAKGMSLALKELCDGIIGIPLSGEVNSLNAACAASICMWEVFRRS
jgi:TrmH family RNA methyltransferase